MATPRADVESEPRLMRTARLELRAMTEADGPHLERLYADPQVAKFIGADRLTAAVVQAQVEKFAAVWLGRTFGQSLMFERATGQVIGRVGLHPWPEWDELELGWVLTRASQGKGLAFEAARRWLSWAARAHVADYLTAVIHPDNAPSIRLATRLGFAFDREDQTPWSPAVVYRCDLSSRR